MDDSGNDIAYGQVVVSYCLDLSDKTQVVRVTP